MLLEFRALLKSVLTFRNNRRRQKVRNDCRLNCEMLEPRVVLSADALTATALADVSCDTSVHMDQTDAAAAELANEIHKQAGIIDVGDLPDGIIDVGDLPGGIIDVGDLPGGIIDVGDLPDGIIDVGDLPDGIIDVGDLPDGIIDIGDLPGGIIGR